MLDIATPIMRKKTIPNVWKL